MPRPAARLPPTLVSKRKASLRSPVKNDIIRSTSKSEEWKDESFTSEDEEGSNSAAKSDSGQSESEQESDQAVPRIAQWLDEDELNADDHGDHSPAVFGVSEQEDSSHPIIDVPGIGNDPLSFGALRALRQDAKKSIAQHSKDYGAGTSIDRSKTGEKPEWSLERRTDLAKRSSKHAPAEMSSKRPVTRRRVVVDVKEPKYRDPRFLPLSGEYETSKFREQYKFLADLHTSELTELRDHLKRARKLLKASPSHLRAEREEGVTRLELAVKRMESLVNKDRQERIEQDALKRLAKEEQEKRKDGKREWWLKKSEKRTLLVRARYEDLAKTRGKLAVTKAIEKKQKKINQKEKRSRPFAPRPSRGPRDRPEDGRSTKRQRIE